MGQRKLATAHIRQDVGDLAASTVTLPHDIKIETAVISAIIVEKDAFHKVKSHIPDPEVFYDYKNQAIWRLAQELGKSAGTPIDTLTLMNLAKKKGLLISTEEMVDFSKIPKRRREKLLRFGVTAVDIVERSNKAASAANIIYHSRILVQLYMRRQAIKNAWQVAEDAADMTKDIFETYGQVQNDFRATNPASILRRQTMNETMIEGAKEPPAKWIAGNLFKEREVAFLYADPGVGKSIFVVQVADAASKGKNLWDHPDFKNECGPKKVILFDFELESNEVYARYSIKNGQNAGEMHEWSDNFIRYSINPEFVDFDNADERFVGEIQSVIETEQPELAIIDNITYISSESQDPAMATKIMKKLLALQKSSPPLSIIVIAHTPKRDMTLPIEDRHLGGAKSLSNFAKSLVAISKSRIDPNYRYIKHVKCRNGHNLHDADNVISVAIEKNGSMLEYAHKGFSSEHAHLMVKEVDEDLKEEAIEYAHKEQKNGMSWRKLESAIQSEFGITMSYSTIRREVEKLREKSLDEAI